MKRAASKRGDFKAPRDPQSGKFERTSPLNDGALLESAVTYAKACADLLPLFQGLSKVGANPSNTKLYVAVHMLLSGLRESILAELALQEDKDAFREAKKTRLRAPYLSRGDR